MLKHGVTEVYVVEDKIFVKELGGFNEYGIKESLILLTNEINKLNFREFALIIDCIEFEGMTPEAYFLLDKYNLWLSKQNMYAKAIINKNETCNFIDKMKVSNNSTQNLRYFSDTDQALLWIEEQSKLSCNSFPVHEYTKYKTVRCMPCL